MRTVKDTWEKDETATAETALRGQEPCSSERRYGAVNPLATADNIHNSTVVYLDSNSDDDRNRSHRPYSLTCARTADDE